MVGTLVMRLGWLALSPIVVLTFYVCFFLKNIDIYVSRLLLTIININVWSVRNFIIDNFLITTVSPFVLNEVSCVHKGNPSQGGFW